MDQNKHSKNRRRYQKLASGLAVRLLAGALAGMLVSASIASPVRAEETSPSSKTTYHVVEVVPHVSQASLGMFMSEVTGEIKDSEETDHTVDSPDYRGDAIAIFAAFRDAFDQRFTGVDEATKAICQPEAKTFMFRDAGFKEEVESRLDELKTQMAEEFPDDASSASREDSSEEEEDLTFTYSSNQVTVPMEGESKWGTLSFIFDWDKTDNQAVKSLKGLEPFIEFSNDIGTSTSRPFIVSNVRFSVDYTIYFKRVSADGYYHYEIDTAKGVEGVEYDLDENSLLIDINNTNLFRKYVLGGSTVPITYEAVTPEGLDGLNLEDVDFLFFNIPGAPDSSSDKVSADKYLETYYNEFQKQIGETGTYQSSAAYSKTNDISWKTALKIYYWAINQKNALPIMIPTDLTASGMAGSNLYKLAKMLFYFKDATHFQYLFDTSRLTDYGNYIATGNSSRANVTADAGTIVTTVGSTQTKDTNWTGTDFSKWKTFSRYLNAGTKSRYQVNKWDIGSLAPSAGDYFFSDTNKVSSSDNGNILLFHPSARYLQFTDSNNLVKQFADAASASVVDQGKKVVFKTVNNLKKKSDGTYVYTISSFSGAPKGKNLKYQGYIDLPFRVDGEDSISEASLSSGSSTSAKVESGTDGWYHLYIRSDAAGTYSVTADGATGTVILTKVNFLPLK